MDSIATSRFLNIPIEQVKPNPWNRTVFDAKALEELTADIKAIGIRERLVVRPLPDTSYQISSGHRRWLAAQKAGLTEIPCEIRALTDEEVARDNIALNIQREDLPLLVLAQMIDQYMRDFHKGKQEAGQVFNKDRSTVSKLLSFLAIDPEARRGCEILTLGWDALEALKASTKEIQLEIAKELKDGTLKPSGIPNRCNILRQGAVSKRGAKPEAPLSDPLGNFFSKLTSNPAVAPLGSWGVSYERRPVGPVIKGKPTSLPARTFWILDDTPTPRATTKKILQALVDAIGDTSDEERQVNKVMEAVIPSTPEEFMQAEKEQSKVRLPETPEEWNEVETLAKDAPWRVYAWTHGEGSVMAQRAKGLSWADLQEPDPIAGCHKLIDGLRQFRDLENK
jgi:ParB/RepB/Spo0J family partition protein